MKHTIKYILQKLLGIRRYLYWFARFKIRTIKRDSKESAFFQFLTLVKEEGDILDVGANLGVMTYHASRQFPDRKIHSVEPIPLNLTILMKIVSRYSLSNVSIDEIALGAENGTLEMVLPKEKNVTLHGLAHVVDDSMEKFNEGDHFQVVVKSLDNYVKDKGITKVAGIKLDVENYEMQVLKGGQGVLQSNRPLIFSELWDNQNRVNCFEFLNTEGYLTFVVRDGKVVSYDPGVDKTQNFIFIPQEKADSLR